jgi:hypothetical protein
MLVCQSTAEALAVGLVSCTSDWPCYPPNSPPIANPAKAASPQQQGHTGHTITSFMFELAVSSEPALSNYAMQ